MIGIFIRNQDDEIGFAQCGSGPSVCAFRLTPERFCMATLNDESEELITSELDINICAPLLRQRQIHVARLDDDGNVTAEYLAPITHDAH